MKTQRLLNLAFLVVACSGAPAQNIVSNGSFEILKYDGGLSLPPWVLGQFGGQFEEWMGPVDGKNFIEFRGLAYQDLSTIPGATYRLSFWTSDLSTDNIHEWPSDLRVRWGSEVVATEQVDWPEWRPLEYLVTATGPMTRLGLEVELGLTHQLRFDAVEAHLVSVPEPRITVLGCIGGMVVWWRRFRVNRNKTTVLTEARR